MEIKDYFCTDIDEIWNWVPDDPSDVWFWLDISVGEVGDDAADDCHILVATPKGLKRKSDSFEYVISDRCLLVVQYFDWDRIVEHLESIVKRCSGIDQIESQWKLQRYFHWEFEDYHVAEE